MSNFINSWMTSPKSTSKINPIQLNKYLSNSGVTSRRKAVELIRQGRVMVNGKVVREPGTRIDPAKDEVVFDGKKVGGQLTFIYLMLNKPKGVISTVADEHGRKTVVELVQTRERLYPVGRLDEDSSGLIILTNDGELANLLTHPRYHAAKTYEVLVSGVVQPRQIQGLQKGVLLKDGLTAPAEVDIIRQTPKGTLLEVTLHEGRNRQIRRMMGAVNLNVLALKRIAIGQLKLGDLLSGQSRSLTKEEVRLLTGDRGVDNL